MLVVRAVGDSTTLGVHLTVRRLEGMPLSPLDLAHDALGLAPLPQALHCPVCRRKAVLLKIWFLLVIYLREVYLQPTDLVILLCEACSGLLNVKDTVLLAFGEKGEALELA